jgi:hypothetical protein
VNTFVNKVATYLAKPTSKVGEIAIITAIGAAVGGTLSWHAALAPIIGGALAILVPDNSVLSTDVEAVVNDLVTKKVALIRAAQPPVDPRNPPYPATDSTTIKPIAGRLP